MDVDVRIKNGVVHTPSGEVEADLLIRGERIFGLVGRDEQTSAAQEIDAAGKHVVPGLIDPHAHTRVPGYEYKEDYVTSSQAAAVGGITCYVDMPNVEPPTDSVATYEHKRRIAEESCVVDWGHFVSGTKLDEIQACAEAGATGFKIFQVSGGYPHDPRLAMGEPERIYAAFDAIAKTGLPCLVHPYNQPLMDLLSQRALAAGKPRNIVTFSEMYTNNVVWSSAVAVLLELQYETGVRLQLLHSHSDRSLKLIKQAKADGQRLTAAIDLKYFQLTDEEMCEQGARAIPGGFITGDKKRMCTIWESLLDGTLDTIDSDHAPHTAADLARMEEDPWTGPFGSPQYDYMFSVVLTDVNAGKLPFAAALRLLSENPARILGIYPRKGAIQVGSDADLVIVDMEREVCPTDEATYTKAKWTPYRGRKLKGQPVLTMLRGQVIAENGNVVGKPGYGKYIAGVAQDPVPDQGYLSPGLAFQPRQNRV
ncbi:MAG: dihydroorotase [Chloroflexota bacterium]